MSISPRTEGLMNKANPLLLISASIKTVTRSSIEHGIYLITLACTRASNPSVVTIATKNLLRRGI